jgi:hypothetical protein
MLVKRIQGQLLDFWVAKSAGLKPMAAGLSPVEPHDAASGCWDPRTYHPSTDWALGGPIVSNEWYVIEDVLTGWFGEDWSTITAIRNDPLKWFMRAYVVSQFGDEVEEVDLSSLFGAEVSYIGGEERPEIMVPLADPMRRSGPMRVLGAMLGRRPDRG